MPIEQVEVVLGRPRHKDLIGLHKSVDLSAERILITGANGSIGVKLIEALSETQSTILPTDISGELERVDINDVNNVAAIVDRFEPTAIVNLAGLKYAPRGEYAARETFSTNTIGTQNLLDSAPPDCRVILASTCKSCNPETVYGATKLIAERMVLNAGGSVVRYFNVVETQGNVFEIWRDIPPSEPIMVVEECSRYFISVAEAAGLIVLALVEGPGRYIVDVGVDRNMKDVAAALYPDRSRVPMKRRRGDRISEKFIATSEHIGARLLGGSVLRIESDHDAMPAG